MAGWIFMACFLIGYAVAIKGSSCWKKNRYSSRWTAVNVVREARERTGDHTLHVYYCRSCHCYHVGHIPFWKRGFGK